MSISGHKRPILSVRHLRVRYPMHGAWPWTRTGSITAVDDVHLDLFAGETLGIVGESGCGKSTLARTLIGLQAPSSGQILLDGDNITRRSAAQWQPLRRKIQMIFQDPVASLDPRMTVGEIVAEPLLALAPELSSSERQAQVLQMLDRVGLARKHLNRYPHEFSGGQCQRVGIARALVVQPRVLMEKVLPQLDALISDDPTQTLFYRPIANFPDAVEAADRERLTTAYTALIRDELMPAYRRLRGFIAEIYLPASRDTVGLDGVPGGEAWYAYLAKLRTTTDKRPAEIHQIGLDEVARIHTEMRRVIKELGFKGDLQAFFKFLDTDPQFEFESEEALLAAYNGLRDKVEAGADKLFALKPKADFEIRPVEPFRAKSAAGGSYQRPSQDGSRPGVFYVNTYDLPSRKIWDMEDLFLHEAIPGHHFHLALQQELTDLPAFRRFGGTTAYTEGWALYAESLGKDLGVYTDPYSYFGYLQNELWRAIRLVVDTGLHSKGWSRKKTIDYMLANSAISETQAVAEAERYMAIPGQALAYKMGELKIKALRAQAEAALGERFDIRAFHTEILRDGSVPLDVLETKVQRWIQRQD